MNELHLYGKGAVTVSNAGGLAEYESYGMPVLYLWGDIDSVTKTNKVTFDYKYSDNTGTCTLKVQGNITAGFPKKNFTWNKISTPFEAKEGWGVQSKYCLKANYNDPTLARNVIGARLWGDVVASRDVVPTELAACPNYGAIDGFPVILVINDEFHGLYTLNIPKDVWTFNLTDGWLIQAEEGAAGPWNGISELLMDGSDFSLEENPNDDDPELAKAAFQRMIDAVNACDGSDWTEVEKYIDIPSVIDYMCFAAMVTDLDGVVKNQLFVTYDKTKFYLSNYDLDSIFGNYWTGKRLVSVGYLANFICGGHLPIFTKIYLYRKNEILARYRQLRAAVMAPETVADILSRYLHAVPLAVRNADSAKWGEMYGSSLDGYMQITDYYRRRIDLLDEVAQQLIVEG